MDLGKGRDLTDRATIEVRKKIINVKYNEVNYSRGSYYLDSSRGKYGGIWGRGCKGQKGYGRNMDLRVVDDRYLDNDSVAREPRLWNESLYSVFLQLFYFYAYRRVERFVSSPQALCCFLV